MRDRNRREIEQWWRDVFDVQDALWSDVTVLHPHGLLGDYEGWYVAWRDGGVHVSAPSSAAAEEVASLTREAPISLQAVEFWHAFAQQRGLEVIGPGMHRYLDDDPGPATGVGVVARDSLLALRDEVSDDDWWESGFEDALSEPSAVAFATDGGGAVLTDLAGAPRNVALLVIPEARGRGVGTALGRAAASYAISNHGFARWRSRDTNVPSSRAAERLGFEPEGVSPESWRRRTPPRSRAGGVANASKTPSLRARRRLASPRLDDAGIHHDSGDTPYATQLAVRRGSSPA